MDKIKLIVDNTCGLKNERYEREYPALKDSWEKLEKDLDRCIEKSDFCMYFTDGESCDTRPINELEPKRRAGAVLESIKMRIRNPRGETHDC